MRVPESDGVLQVGAQRDFDGFPVLSLSVLDADNLVMERKDGDLIQIEAPIMDKESNSRIRRSLLENPVERIRVTRQADSSAWIANIELADPSYRVGISRFFAKVGETAIRKGPIIK